MARKRKKARRRKARKQEETTPKRRRRRKKKSGGRKRRSGGRRKRRGGSRRRRSGGRRKRSRKGYRFTKARRRALNKARRARVRRLRSGRGRKHRVRPHRARRRKKAWHVRGHMSRERRGALENPLTGMELLAGGIAGVVYGALANLADRFMATREGASVKSPAAPIYKDLPRLGVAVAFTAVPLIGAHWVRKPALRASLQFAGLAAGFSLADKLLSDVSAKLLVNNDTGKRLFAGEMIAQQASSQTGPAGLPQGAANGDENKLPPVPPVGAGQPDVSQAAIDAVKRHAPALRALGALAPAFAAVGMGKATEDQKRQVADVQSKYAESIKALRPFSQNELKAAMGLAGVTPNAGALPASPPASPPPARAPQQPVASAVKPSRFNWANNG